MRKLFLNKKRIITFSILFIILFCVISIVYQFNKKNEPFIDNNNNTPQYNKNDNAIVKPEQKFVEFINKDFELNNHVKKYANKHGRYSIEIDYIENHILYGSILDTNEHSMLFVTICLFQYNLKTKEYKEYKYNKGRIFNYYIDGEDIYYVAEEVNNKNYSWRLNKSTLSFKNNKILDFGNVDNDMDSPRLLKDNVNNALYLFTIKNNGNIQTSDFYKINGERLELLETFFGHHDTKKGSFIYEMLFITIHNGKIYYIRVDDYEKNSLLEYDVISKNTKVLKEDSIDNYYQEFFVTDLGIFMNTRTETETKNYFKKTEDEDFRQLENYNKEFYFGRKLNDYMMLFISGSQWYVLDTDNFKMFAGPKCKEQYPKYFVLKDNQVLYQDFDDHWYTGSFK